MNLSKTKVFQLKLSNGTDTSDATATAADILLGKTAYVADGKVAGTYNKLQQFIDNSIIEMAADDLIGLTIIRDRAFYYCYGLKSITIPNSVTYIGEYAFAYCYGLTSITIPNSVTSIRMGTFYECNGLKSITIPNSVTSIDYEAFMGCSGLTSIAILTIIPPLLADTSAFISTNNCPIYVPAESVNAYKTATNWASFASRIQAIPE